MSFPRLNGSDVPSGFETSLLSAREGRSIVVNVVSHAGHVRRRHTEGSFLRGLELETRVVLWKQFIQNMSIY